MPEAYKVAEFRSWADGWRENAASITNVMPRKSLYYIDQWTEREEGYGPLTAFSNLVNLWEFMLSCSKLWHYTRPYRFILPPGWVVFRCNVEKSEDVGLWAPNGSRMTGKVCPAGTVFADKIQLLNDPVRLLHGFTFKTVVYRLG